MVEHLRDTHVLSGSFMGRLQKLSMAILCKLKNVIGFIQRIEQPRVHERTKASSANLNSGALETFFPEHCSSSPQSLCLCVPNFRFLREAHCPVLKSNYLCLNYPQQLFFKCRPVTSMSPEKLWELQMLEPHPQTYWKSNFRAGSPACVSTSPAADSDTRVFPNHSSIAKITRLCGSDVITQDLALCGSLPGGETGLWTWQPPPRGVREVGESVRVLTVKFGSSWGR